jgi:hypothetical protein
MTKPAPYSPTAGKEIEAVIIFESLIICDQVIPDLRRLDKFPNIDGNIDIIDVEHRPIGRLEVQVKKLPDDYGSDPKLQVPISLFGYASRTTNNPVLLVGVDANQKKAFWFHVPADINKKFQQETITIKFLLTQVINGKDRRYLNEWLGIVQDYQRRLREFNSLKAAYSKLISKEPQVLSIAGSDISEIHGFLDEINSLLDGPFRIVKRRFYPSAWKVGLAYHSYEATSVGYTLYPILADENNVQIRQLDKNLTEEFLSLHGFRWYYSENPIKSRPREHALEHVEERLNRILGHRLLDHRGSEALAREYIFAFIDRFADQMGLDQRESYSLAEIENGFYRHFPFWIDEAVKFLVQVQRNRITKPSDCYFGKAYLDADMLRGQIMPNEIDELEQIVINRLKGKELVPILRVGSENFPFGLFVEFLSSLVSGGVTEIQRLYAPEDESQAPQGGFLWQFYSPEDLEKNLKSLFDNLPGAYSAIVEQNFPQLKADLALFDGATRVIGVLDVESQPEPRAGIHFYCLKCQGELNVHIDLCRKAQNTYLDKLSALRLGDSIELEGKAYELVGHPSMVLYVIWVDFPILSFVYRELQGAFRSYFDRCKRVAERSYDDGKPSR